MTRELESITAEAKGSILNPDDLEENSRELLDRYMNYKVCTQASVFLLLSRSIMVVTEQYSF